MARPTYTFVRPTDGKTFPWSPLTVGDEMDIQAGHRREEMRHLIEYALLARRLKMEGGANELREWETVDLAALIAHVTETEAARAAALSKAKGSSVDMLDALAKEVTEKHVALLGAVRDFVAAARVAQTGPLGATPQT